MKFLPCLLSISVVIQSAAAAIIDDQQSLRLPAVGDYSLHILSPTVLEMTLVTTKAPDPARATQWDFAGQRPAPAEFNVVVDGKTIPVQAVGFKRRPLYAPLKQRDLRIDNWLYLQLASPVLDGQTVEVKNPSGKLWGTDKKFSATMDPARWNPVVHVNQEGYLPDQPKKAMAGFYLGSLGELNFPSPLSFKLVNAATRATVLEGTFKPRRDVGYPFQPVPYQNVLEADFSACQTPGEYQLVVPGFGASYRFSIDDGIAADFARAYALGLYHQRCGAANEMPYTRFVHAACHLRPAEIPVMSFKAVNEILENMTGDFGNNPRHSGPRLKTIDASLYPFVNKGRVDVSGGHHDAGDYSKYTINVAHLIHTLVFAADAFPGVGDLDNLGLPESGDGRSDVLQEAKWEADFLAKMQDADGGFYFLVYPKEREYEADVLPEHGDPQVVYPKTTAVTAAAVAALAQTASSPRFKAQFPREAAVYLAGAKKGWDFLQRALAKYGREGSYQKITHYGDEFMQEDELVWAATELFLATGDKNFEKEVLEHFDPESRDTRRWTWVRMFESYGNAIRSYAFAAKTKRLDQSQLDEKFFTKCENEIIAAAEDNARFSDENAYGTSFPDPSKKFRNAGWYFSLDRAFDIAVAAQLKFPIMNDPRPHYLETMIANMNYEGGCNPVNMVYVTGLGWRRQREMVHHFAQNDRRVLPPTGLALGNIQEGFAFLDPYKKELGALTFPADGDEKNPYPFYDRWGDSFNTSTEFVTVNLARAFAASAALMGRTSSRTQEWRSASAKITGLPASVATGSPIKITLSATNLDLSRARCVWEAAGQEPSIYGATQAFTMTAGKPGVLWIEAEAWLPDGRRVFASTNLTVTAR